MRNSKHAQWSDEELPGLVGNGVVTPEMAEKLRQHYGEVETGGWVSLAKWYRDRFYR